MTTSISNRSRPGRPAQRRRRASARPVRLVAPLAELPRSGQGRALPAPQGGRAGAQPQRPDLRWGLGFAAILGVLMFLSWSPTLSVLTVNTLAGFTGCTAGDLRSNACLVPGVDIGHQLYSLGVMGLLVLSALPALLLGSLAWLAWEAACLLRERRGRNRAAAES